MKPAPARAALLCACALATASVPARAADPGDGLDGAEVQMLVQEALERAGVPGRANIAALRPYPACDSLPRVEPRQGDWSTVSIRCPAPVWQRAVRTGHSPGPRLQQGAGDGAMPTGEALVLTESLPRGTMITAEHLVLAPAERAHLDGALSTPEAAIGRRLLVNLGEGRVLQARHLDHDWLVAEGSLVAIHAGIPGVSVSTGGIAVQSGQLGEVISVRNTRSGKVLQALVTDRSNVTVAPNMN